MKAFSVEVRLKGSLVIKAKDEAEARKIANDISFDDWEIEPMGSPGEYRIEEVDPADYFDDEE